MRDRIGASARVTAPATSANLGPGFDSFGLSLDLRDTVTARVTPRGLRVQITGAAADSLPRDESHLVVASMRKTFSWFGVAQPGLDVTCHNVIPHGRGLGSSAAAIVAGVLVAAQLAGRTPSTDELLDLATRLEGHPDNVAACLLGAFTISWRQGGRWHSLRLATHLDIRPLVFVPQSTLATSTARDLLPSYVAHADASANAGLAGLLVAALTQHPESLLAATRDRLHQDHRRSAMPETLALVDAMREDGVAAVVSGAGPSVLALGTARHRVDPRRWARPGWECHELSIDTAGALRELLTEPSAATAGE